MANSRPSPAKLISTASKRSGFPGWYDNLPREDRDYVDQVAACLRENPQASVYAVASRLKEELGIKVGREQVVRKLKELLSA